MTKYKLSETYKYICNICIICPPRLDCRVETGKFVAIIYFSPAKIAKHGE